MISGTKGGCSLIGRALITTLIFSCGMLVIFASPPGSDVDGLPRGEVIPKIVSSTDTKYSYAIYLPSYYTEEKTFPVIFAFDPVARGPVPVGRFKEAAEKYGYIVVASNNSRNGLRNFESGAIRNMVEETLARFSINRNRVYLTGFSGGARLALSFADSTNGVVAGVVICGAGFSPQSPRKDLPFAIYGTVGDEDFNYSEMRTLDKKLSELNLAHHFEIFAGSHDWASSDLCIKALEWLDLQAMKTHRLKKDDTFIENVWKRSVDEATNFETHGKPFEAFNAVNALVQDFRGLRDVSEIERKLNPLQADKAVKRVLKTDKDEIEKETDLTKQLMAPGLEMMQSDGADRSIKMSEIGNLAAVVRKRSKVAENTSGRRAARRILRSAIAYYQETAIFNFIPNKKFDAAIIYMEIETKLEPKDNFIYVRLARVYMAAGQKKQALGSLQNAIEKGITNLRILEQDKAFDGLPNEPAWNKLITEIKPKSVTNRVN